LLEQIDGLPPVLLAAHGELIEVAADMSGGKDELAGKRPRAAGDRAAIDLVPIEDRPVPVAVRSIRRVDARALAADLRHGSIPARMQKYKLVAGTLRGPTPAHGVCRLLWLLRHIPL